MSHLKSSGRVELAGIFQYMQSQMLSQLSAGDFLEQPTSWGSVSEQHWLELFSQYLPQRYAASPAFVVDADGRRPRSCSPTPPACTSPPKASTPSSKSSRSSPPGGFATPA